MELHHHTPHDSKAEQQLLKMIQAFKEKQEEFLSKAFLAANVCDEWRELVKPDLEKMLHVIDSLTTHHQIEINSLEERITYLNEVIQAQRMMMSDNLDRLLELEKKLAENK